MKTIGQRIALSLVISLVFGFGSTAFSQPNISVDPIDHNFGSINIGSLASKTTTVTNTGSLNLLISSIHITPAGEFSKGTDNCSGQTLLPTESCTIEARFLPMTEGLKGAEISIPSNDQDTPTQIVALSGTGTLDPVFSDCPEDYWAEDFIHTIYYGGVTMGCLLVPTLQYCPANPVTREQMAAFIVRAVEGEPDPNYCLDGSPFGDVPVDSGFCKYIKRLSQLNITQGCAAGMYCPTDNVLRQQMAAFLVRAIEGEPLPDYCDTGIAFTDVETISVFCKYIKRLVELGVTQGCAAGMYCPSNNVLRDQMAAFLARAFILPVLVPDTVGMIQSEAETLLLESGLVKGTINSANSNTVPLGRVISQTPVAGVSVLHGSSVNLVISLGPVMVPVPDVVGMIQANAEAAITSANLTVGTITTANSLTVPAGSVISQDPVGGTSAPQGSAVNLVVSLGPATVTVPNVVGMTQTNAESAIIAVGLIIGTITTANSETVPPGNVISQNPAEGLSVIQGSPVSLVISLGPPGLPPDPSTVAPPLDLTVATSMSAATSFLYTGNNPIQTGVAPGTIDPKRVVVLRGKVLDRNNNPLYGVAISILNHPEFGQTLTRFDGMFDLAVNGGETLTVKYQKTGYLPVQRQVNTLWQKYAHVDDVILISQDARLNPVDLTDTTQSFQVAQGSVITDQDGTRQATLLIPQGTQAQVYNPDGTTRPVTNLNLRLTEYTVGSNGPKSMPAPLPPTSAYTYAFEMKAEEANVKINGKDALFDRPVPFYITNFLNFPVGAIVPVGYYDSDKAVWVPSDNGKVIKILAINNGIADLDTDGDGLADDGPKLAALGISDQERGQLANLYVADQTLWRVQVGHLSTWDCNWPYMMPDDAVAPSNPPPEGGAGDVDNPAQRCGSIIECENQILRESLPITGTGMTLNYASSRVPGRKVASTLTIPVSGSVLPASLMRIDVIIEVAGRLFRQSLPAQTNQSTTFTWDGRDAFGRPVAGIQQAIIRIGYVYPPVYATPAQLAMAFALFSGVPLEGSRARNEVILWQYQTKNLAGAYPFADSDHLGGWTLNVHHTYEPNGELLSMGNGSQRSVQGQAAGMISTVAGTGVAGYDADGLPATAATLNYPYSVAVGSDGSLYIADTLNHRVRRVSPDGVITTVAGNGLSGYGGDGGPATAAKLVYPEGVAVGSDGSLYIADSGNHRIRQVGSDGVITTVAGIGVTGYGGDGGPAIDAMFHYPEGVAVGSDGSLYIVDTGNYRIRRVGADGVITTVAGGNWGSLGDGGPATNAMLNVPYGMAVGSDGSFYIADFNNSRIRRVGPDGIITTVAGDGYSAYRGDGGPATAASIANPRGVAVASDGSLYIADSYNYRIRRVGPDGIITTVAGIGVMGYSGDGVPATAARINVPYGVAVGSDGSLYIADARNNRIRKVGGGFYQALTTGEYVFPSEEGTEIFVFSLSNRHLRTVNTLTGAVLYSFTYDGGGRLTQVTDRDGNITTIERDGLGTPTAIVGPYGQRTALQTDSSGYLMSVTNPAGELHSMAYSAEGLLTQFTNPRGNTARMNYDALGRLVRDTDAAGGFTQLTRTGTDQSYTVSLASALGRTTHYQVDRLTAGGQRRTTTAPAGTQTQETIGTDGSRTINFPDGTVSALLEGPDPRFLMQAPIMKSLTVATGGLTANFTRTRTVALTNPDNVLSLNQLTDTVTLNGRTSTSVYDGPSKTATFTSAAGRISTMVLDSLGRPTHLQIAGFDPVSTAYDSRGRPSTVTFGARTLTYGYTLEYLTSETNPLGQMTRYEYDAAGRVTRTTLPDGRQILFTYDGAGNLTSLTPPGRSAHVFRYNVVDLPTGYEPPLLPSNGGSTLYQYDADRAVTRIIRPDGGILDFGYDTAGRLSTLSLPQGQIRYTYDSAGRLVSLAAPDGRVLLFTYQGALLTTTTSSSGIVGRTYDADFRLASISVNGANSTSYTYDADSLLTQAGTLVLSRRSDNGLLNGTTLGVVSDSRTHNSFGEISGYSAQANAVDIFATQYTRDSLGRITSKAETVEGVPHAYDYGYDVTGHLREVRKDGAVTANYSYDFNGNRLSGPGLSIPPTYDAQDRLISYGGATYGYTANGELSSKTVGALVTTYQYDALGGLRRAGLPDGRQIDYVIDGFGRRIGKKVDGALVQGFLYQDGLKPVAELNGANGVVTRFVYATRINVPDYMVKGGVTYRIITDHLGSPRLVVDTADGTIAQRMVYDEWGNVILDDNPGFQPFGFAGGLYDQDTKLVRFGARDYDAATGRWTLKDPIGFAGGDANLYSYVANDTINWADPWGLQGWEPWPGDPPYTWPGVPWPYGPPPTPVPQPGPGDACYGVSPTPSWMNTLSQGTFDPHTPPPLDFRTQLERILDAWRSSTNQEARKVYNSRQSPRWGDPFPNVPERLRNVPGAIGPPVPGLEPPPPNIRR